MSKPPPLPKPIETGVIHQRRYIGSVYTAEQMRDYAQQAVEADRRALLGRVMKAQDVDEHCDIVLAADIRFRKDLG